MLDEQDLVAVLSRRVDRIPEEFTGIAQALWQNAKWLRDMAKALLESDARRDQAEVVLSRVRLALPHVFEHELFQEGVYRSVAEAVLEQVEVMSRMLKDFDLNHDTISQLVGLFALDLFALSGVEHPE